jgi:hypothetical protein
MTVNTVNFESSKLCEYKIIHVYRYIQVKSYLQMMTQVAEVYCSYYVFFARYA